MVSELCNQNCYCIVWAGLGTLRLNHPEHYVVCYINILVWHVTFSQSDSMPVFDLMLTLTTSLCGLREERRCSHSCSHPL